MNSLVMPIFFAVFVYLVFENYRLKNKYTSSLSELLKARMDNNVKDGLIKEASKFLDKGKQDASEVQEHFIKFLSDSRDSAFVYIENTQKSIFDYINNVEQYILDTKNDILISELEKIKKILPDDYGKMDI